MKILPKIFGSSTMILHRVLSHKIETIFSCFPVLAVNLLTVLAVISDILNLGCSPEKTLIMFLALVLHIQSGRIIDAGARLSLRRATTHFRGSCGLVGRLTSTKCSVSFRLRPSQPVLFATRCTSSMNFARSPFSAGDTDSPLEETGFEPSVPTWDWRISAASRRQSRAAASL
jgi:hypothetical protein